MTSQSFDLTRRDLLTTAALIGGHCVTTGLLGPRLAGAAPPPGRKVLFEEPWGNITELGDRVWGVVSTPLASNDWKTLSCGGVIAGDERVVAVEAFMRDEGAAWVAERAVDLTGRRPTDVIITHYHGDHVGGLAGYAAGDDRPTVWMTRATLDLVLEDEASREAASPETGDPVRTAMLEEVAILDADQPTELELGGRSAVIHPRSGHTASDVSVELGEPDVVFCGDLLWQAIFPNYRDTRPAELSRSARAIRRDAGTTYVAGHGPLATDADYQVFVDVIDAIEAAARGAVEKGVPLTEAALAFRLPEAAADWHLFRENYFEIALGAWYRELGA